MKNPIIAVSLVLLLSTTFGCKQAEKRIEEPVLDAGARAEALRTLRETDKAWSQSAPNLDAFMSFIADEVVWLYSGTPPMTSWTEVRSFCEEVFRLPGYSLSWTPNRIEVDDAGDMGYAYGSYRVSYRDSSGLPVEKTRNYATVWRKQRGGGWKCVLEADY